jgi:serine phosphatase RsbU (regulator of sigma subunit)
MRLGTKILLLMLLITVGTSATLAWIVTLNVTRYETRRADEKIGQTIERYVTQLGDRHRQIDRIVRALLEAPAPRSQLQAADESGDPAAREQLKQEVLGRTVQTELESPEGSPAFHVLVNLAGEVLLAAAPGDAPLEKTLTSSSIKWPVDAVVAPNGQLVRFYVSTPAGLFLAMGVPLHTQLDEAASHAYFVGFRADDQWLRRQLLSDRSAAGSMDAPLSAWIIINDKVVARASSDPSDQRIDAFTTDTMVNRAQHAKLPASRPMAGVETEFTNAGEHYLGQSFDLSPAEAKSGRLVLASSLDQALLPLKSLQEQILICTVVACIVAVIACRVVAGRIVRPIQELVVGTQRIAAGRFDEPVAVKRRDELGVLAGAFNDMSQGLKERDVLRDERTKIERDLALARKIQMDVLPKFIPACPGYDLAAYSLPAEQTGGDIYDLVAVALDEEITEGPPAMVLLLADATGHGVGPALSVTQVRAMLRIGVRLRASLDHVFAQINRQLCQDLGAGRFVTAFLGLLRPSDHCVNYHSAGQAPLLHFRAKDQQFSWLDSSTLPLGIDEEPYDDGIQRIILEPGDLVVLLTDGFYEFQNQAGDLFGNQRIAEVILATYRKPAKEILAALLEAVRAFGRSAPQLDDMTALIIKRLPADHISAGPDGPDISMSAPSMQLRSSQPHVENPSVPQSINT